MRILNFEDRVRGETTESVRRIELSALRPNVSLADNLFVFNPPAGVQVHEF